MSLTKSSVLILVGLLFTSLTILALISVNADNSGEGWWDTGWLYRKIVSISHTKVAANLTNFPVLINIMDSDIASHAQDNGSDIVFVDSTGNKMDHETEIFDKTNGQLIAWVKFPLLSASVNTEFYIYYGNLGASCQENAEGVWDSGFLAVHHLSETSGIHSDSTSNNNDGVPYGSLNQNASGKVGGCDEFDGVNDYVELPQVFVDETEFTFSAWMYARSGARYFVSQWSNFKGACLQVYADRQAEFYVNNERPVKPMSMGEWHYVVGTFDGTIVRLYVDGSSPATFTSSITWPSQNLYIGDRSDHRRQFNGFIDEIRLSNMCRSQAWIITEYNNQKNPSTFYKIGNEEFLYAPRLSDPSPENGAEHIGFNPVLSINVSNPLGNNMTIIFISNASGTWEELGRHTGGDEVYTQSTTNIDNFNTTYYWRIIAIDNENGEETSRTYYFTTAFMLELKWTADLPGVGQIMPVIGDINGDGQMEIVTSCNGYVVALNGTNGNILWSYPGATDHAIQLADLTNDGIPEVLAADGRKLVALFGDGTLYWQSEILSGEGLCRFPIVAYDIDGDGYPTIYFATEDVTDPDFTGSLTALDHKGEVLCSTFVYHPCWGGPTVADYDFDGEFEIYMGDRRERVSEGLGKGMRSWWAGNLTSRWNQTGVFSSSAMPVLVDWNEDGQLEVIALNVINEGLAVLSAADGRILQDDRTGYTLPDGSKVPPLPSHCTPTVYDIDLDGNLEVILSVSRPELPKNFLVWDLTRRKVDANISLPYYCVWPPSVGDVDSNGIMEIIAATGVDIFIYDHTYDLIDRMPVAGAGQLTTARLQDIDDDGLNELVVGGYRGKILAYDTVVSTPNPAPRTEIQYYSEYRRNAAEHVEPPGPSEPILLNEQPSDGSIKEPLNPTLSIRSHDYQHDLIITVFETNTSGVWEELGKYTGGNGIYNQTTTEMNSYNTTYFWAVNATDSKGHWSYRVYKFTTQGPPPTIDSYYPLNNPTIYEGESQEFNVTYSDPNGDNVTVQWYLNGTPTVSTDSYIFEANYTSAGIYNVTVTLSTDQGQTSHNWMLTVLNVNRPPEASELLLSPFSPLTTDDLVGNYVYYDADGDSENGTEIRWYLNGTLKSQLNDKRIVPANQTSEDDEWFFTVKPKDGQDFGNLQTSPTVTIQNIPSWWDTDWQYRKEITIDHTKVAANLTNFPLLIDVVDFDLASKAQVDGDDIVFTDVLGNKLNHEIELYDSNGGHLVVWVDIPFLSSIEDTCLYMYYGNPGASCQENAEGVWDSGFLAVHHLSEISGIHNDSTSNNNDGVPYGSLNQNASGKVGGCDEFDGVNDYVELPQVFMDEVEFTFSTWMYARSGARYFVSQWSNFKGACLQVYADRQAEFYVNNERPVKPMSMGEWHYVVGTFDGTIVRLYVDGSSPATFTSSITWPSQNLYIGDRSDHRRQFNGFIDEIRLSNMCRSQAWIITEYNNQKNPSSFYTIGNEGSRDESVPDPYSTVADNISLDLAVRLPKHHKIWYAAGRWWVIFGRTGSTTYYSSSLTGYLWEDRTLITDECPVYWSDTVFDGQYTHFVRTNGSEYGLYYRRGICCSNGTIIWGTEYEVIPPEDSWVDDPGMAIDSEGHVYVGYNNRADPYVIKNEWTNGSWHTATGYPLMLWDSPNRYYVVAMLNLTNNKMYAVIFQQRDFIIEDAVVRGRLYNGSDWEPIEIVSTSYIDNTFWCRLSAVSIGDDVHIVFMNKTTYELIHIKRDYGSGWGDEEVVHSPDIPVQAVISANNNDGRVYVFWQNDPIDNRTYYRSRSSSGTWDMNYTDWFVDPDGTVTNHTLQCSFQVINGHIGFLYVGKRTYPYEVRFAKLQVDDAT